MMKLKDYPVTINSTAIPNNPTSWSESSEVVEVAQTTEAGTDVVDIQRTDKLHITASFEVDSAMCLNFETWARATSQLTVKIYDQVSQAYVTRYMRMRSFTKDYVQNSHNTSGTVGLWSVNFELIEF